VAELVLRRTSGGMPTDVEALALQHANVERYHWPFKCDALTVGLLSPRPTIYLRQQTAARRERFTLAHELGHVLLGWHFGDVACSPANAVTTQDSLPARGLPLGFMRMEQEANDFASHLLLPWSYLNGLAATEDMPILLTGLTEADVSAFAGLLALRRVLQPGFVFRFDAGNGDIRVITTTGTGSVDTSTLSGTARDHGRWSVSDRVVFWWRLTEFSGLPAVEPTPSRELLDLLISQAGLTGPAAAARKQKIQATTSGILSKLHGDAAQTVASLRHRFEQMQAHTGDLDPALLDRFIIAKVQDRFRKLNGDA
jgi:hypothetical protein